MESKDDDDRDKACPVCLEDFSTLKTTRTRPENSSVGISKRRRRRTAAVNTGGEVVATAFPCGHRTCQTCFERCTSCPICRTGKDSSSHSERREAEARQAHTAVDTTSFARVVTFEGSRGNHPFNGLHIAVFGGVPAPLRAMLPDAISQHMQLEIGPNGRSLFLRARRGDP